MPKQKLQFFDTQSIPWKPIQGVAGQYEKILNRDPETGSYTRLLLVLPDLASSIGQYGSPPSKVLCHENMWEEVFLVKGVLVDATRNKTFGPESYAYHHPRMKHGPFFAPIGALTLEVRTFV